MAIAKHFDFWLNTESTWILRTMKSVHLYTTVSVKRTEISYIRKIPKNFYCLAAAEKGNTEILIYLAGQGVCLEDVDVNGRGLVHLGEHIGTNPDSYIETNSGIVFKLPPRANWTC
jgi:hypothetical protein